MPEMPLTMTPSTLTYQTNLDTGMKVSLNQMLGGTKGVSQFPIPWPPQSADPTLRVIVQNGSVTASIAPVLLYAYVDSGTTPATTQYVIAAELSTVQPGQTLGGGAGETIQMLPVTQLILCCWYIAIAPPDIANGFNVTVQAFAG